MLEKDLEGRLRTVTDRFSEDWIGPSLVRRIVRESGVRWPTCPRLSERPCPYLQRRLMPKAVAFDAYIEDNVDMGSGGPGSCGVQCSLVWLGAGESDQECRGRHGRVAGTLSRGV